MLRNLSLLLLVYVCNMQTGIGQTITTFAPLIGCPGTTITINGTNLANATAVKIGNTSVSSILSNTATQIRAIVAPGTTTGFVSVTTQGGTTATSTLPFAVATSNAGIVTGTSPLCIGQTVTYTATGGDPGGTWSSTNTSVATVNSTSGVVTALSTGTTNITYTVGCTSSFKTLTVSLNANAGTVSGQSPMCIGGTTTYTSTGDAGGAWSSSNPSVAIIDSSTGIVIAVAAGTTNIIYRVSTGCNAPVSANKTLTVSMNPNAGTVNSVREALCIGENEQFTTTGNAGGTWSSSNSAVATVNAITGLVTAVGAGITNIVYTVTSDCNIPASAFKTLRVAPNLVATPVSGTSPLCIGQNATYTTILPGAKWTSSNPAVATVDSTTGVVTAVSAGTTRITYTIRCNATDFKTLTVNPIGNAGIVSGMSPLCPGQITQYSTTGDAGGTWSSTNTNAATVNASTGVVTAIAPGSTDIVYTVGCNGTSRKTLTVSPNANAGTVSGTSPLCIGATATYTSTGTTGGTWTSTNSAVATVNPSTGLVTAVTAGTTDITYTVGCNATAFKTLTVSPNANAGTITGTSPLCMGATASYNKSGDPGGIWTSTNTSVATVNATTGLVTAVTAGTTNITYTVGCNATAFKTLTVSPNANAGTITGASPLCIGATDNYTSDGDAGGTWSSSIPAVASVSVSGLVTALSAGTTVIRYTVGCNAIASKTLTVSPNATAGTVNGNTPLCIGQTTPYTSTGNAGGTWSSTNTAVASVDAVSGLVTALTDGTTNITYTVSTGCNNPFSSFKTLTVSPNATAGAVSGTSPLCIGRTATYTSNGDAGGTWSSTDTAVAKVNASTGVVTTVRAGTTNITYTVSTGCNNPFSSFKTLTVSPNATAGAISGTTPMCINATATYTSNGDTGGTWSSSTPAVATVHPSTGLVTALTAGTTVIKYKVTSGCNPPDSSSRTLIVSPNANAGAVSGTSPLCIGRTATYTSNGDAGGTWSSTNTAVATVNATSGLVTALTAGTTNITYTVSL